MAAFGITAVAGALMVSGFGYPSFKQFNLDRRIRFVYMMLVPLFFVLVAIDPPTMLLSIFGVYAASAPLLWVGRRIRRLFRGAAGSGPPLISQRAPPLPGGAGHRGVAAAPRRRPRAARARAPARRTAAGAARRRCRCRSGPRDAPLWQQLTEEVLALHPLRAAPHPHPGRARGGRPRAPSGWWSARPRGRGGPAGRALRGRAGQLLDAMLRAIGLARGTNVYIANILKSRPPGNRDPAPAEVAACLPYLERQIELIRPRLILAVGRIAMQNLLGTDGTWSHARPGA